MALTAMIREQVLVLRRRGGSYGQIATELGLSRNTVKSLCQRAGVTPDQAPEPATACEHCGAVLETTGSGRRFCSMSCRLAWWHAHPESLTRKAIYTFTCPACQRGFSAYGNARRKYCSHSCYIRHRFGTKGGRT